MDYTNDLYKVLDLNKNATNEEIKKSFRKLVLKWHPDKNKAPDAKEKFNHIKIAYEILSNKESREKYDTLNDSQHDNLLKVICNFVKSIINPENINKLINIICANDIYMCNEIKTMENVSTDVPDYNKLKEKIEQRLQNKIDLDYINNFMHTLLCENNAGENKLNNVNLEDVNLSIFFGPDEIIPEKSYQLIHTMDGSVYSDKNGRSTNTNTNTNTNTSEMNIYGEIKTTLEEVYAGKSKELNVVRQIIENNILIFRTYKYTINLTSDQVIIDSQGDEYYDENNNIRTGKLIIDIKCKKHLYFKRVNENDILVSLPLTLYELFSGFNKTFDYFINDSINLRMINGFNKIKSNKLIYAQSKFDGQKIIVTLSGLGLLLDGSETNRGNLIIYLVLIKKDNFLEKLKKNFDN